MRTVLTFCFVLLFAFNVYAVQVLVNVWDGSEYSVINQLYTNNELPNLKSIGVLKTLYSDQTCFEGVCMRTATKAQHATMLTGCLSDVHKVFSNDKFKMIPDGYTVMELIKAAYPNTKIAFITGKMRNVGSPIFMNIVDEVDFYQAENIGRLQVTEKAIELIGKWSSEDFFIFAHFRTPDVMGHMYGVNSEEYKNAIKLNDEQLGRLLSIMPSKGKIYVLADHGFGYPIETEHLGAPNTFG